MHEQCQATSGATSVRDRMRNAPGLHLGHAIGALVAVESLITTVVVVALAPRAQLPVALLIVLAAGPAALWLVGAALRVTIWAPWQRRFPAFPQSPEAVVKPCQSVRLGDLVWINNAVHVAADERAMHLIPLWFMRAGGCGVVSIPWEAFADSTRSNGRPGVLRTTVAGRGFAGPAWAVRLAHPATGGPTETAT